MRPKSECSNYKEDWCRNMACKTCPGVEPELADRSESPLDDMVRTLTLARDEAKAKADSLDNEKTTISCAVFAGEAVGLQRAIEIVKKAAF